MVTPNRPTGLVGLLVEMALRVIPGRSVRRLRPNGENTMFGSLLLPAGLLVVMALFVFTSFAVSASSPAPGRGKTGVAAVALRIAMYTRFSMVNQRTASIVDQQTNIVKRLDELQIDHSQDAPEDTDALASGMARPWRTVHRSPHKIVMVKPRKHHHPTTNRHHNTPPAQNDTDLSCLWPLMQLIVAVFMMIFAVGLLISAWPVFLVALIVFLIIVACGG